VHGGSEAGATDGEAGLRGPANLAAVEPRGGPRVAAPAGGGGARLAVEPCQTQGAALLPAPARYRAGAEVS